MKHELESITNDQLRMAYDFGVDMLRVARRRGVAPSLVEGAILRDEPLPPKAQDELYNALGVLCMDINSDILAGDEGGAA